MKIAERRGQTIGFDIAIIKVERTIERLVEQSPDAVATVGVQGVRISDEIECTD